MTRKLLFLLAILPSVLFAQHTIKGTFTPAKEFEYAFLYRVTAETSLFVANADVAQDGTFEITLDKNAIPGTYRLVYAQPQDQFNFDIIVNNTEDIELKYDLENGLTFDKSSENKLYSSYKRSLALINKSIRNYYNTGKEDKTGYSKIFNILKRTQDDFEKASDSMIVNHFIKAYRPYMPNGLEDVRTFSENIKSHYLSHIDFGNENLQNSNFLVKTTIDYTIGFIDQNNPDASYMENVDTVVKAIGDNPKIKSILLEVLWNQFSVENNEVVANYIGSKYLLDIALANNNSVLANNIIYFKNVSIGNLAPDFNLEVKDKEDKMKTSKLSALDGSNNYLIFFWSTTCSHCLKEIPLLKEFIQANKKEDIQVIAVALDNDLKHWKDLTSEYPDFIHVFGEGKWNNTIGNQYNVTSTPSYFLLDKNKKIISKPYDINEFKKYFESLSTVEKKE
ncbi:TlpA family protein disulfide reductase [Lacinutrix jangbogonensis]|uniref:TlpA family protein disulfide reductase n=1 Tax=Lacinutrix jangbogonensis TaxID=1469557 RepID=UPI00053E5C34|nr:TlpA disulfide reductase family protein [Lacinutrix jangbogonensis]